MDFHVRMAGAGKKKAHDDHQDTGKRHTTVQLDVVRDHQHHLPFKDVVIDEATTDPGDILIGLHLL